MRRSGVRAAQSFTSSPCRPRYNPRSLNLNPNPNFILNQTFRHLQIDAVSQSSTTPPPTIDTFTDAPSADLAPLKTGPSPDARFEVLGNTSSLLSISLSASQNLYTRRGSLVGVSGSPDNAVSTLSPLSPLVRAPLGIPFLYQKTASTTPLNLLIATRAQHTSFSVIHLDGRQDWVVAQRKGLVAWTGHTLNVKPSVNLKMSLAHWGSTIVTGRGLIALAGPGQIYQITLNTGEEYVAHPSNILAYTMTPSHPLPYRFKSSTIRLQLPSISPLLARSKFLQDMANTKTWQFLANFVYTLRRWGRSTLMGDRLFLHFHGPQTILLQSRGSTLRDALTARDIDEIAEAPPGLVFQGRKPASIPRKDGASGEEQPQTAGPGAGAYASPARLSYATVDKGRRVTFGKQEGES